MSERDDYMRRQKADHDLLRQRTGPLGSTGHKAAEFEINRLQDECRRLTADLARANALPAALAVVIAHVQEHGLPTKTARLPQHLDNLIAMLEALREDQ